jgi:acyl dehydratase
MRVSHTESGDRYADDVVPGTAVELGSWTVTQEEIVAFARQWDPQLLHVDRQWAEASPLGGLIASGVHTMGILQRMTVDTVLSTFAYALGRRITGFRMPRPVRPGDTLSGTLEFVAVALRADGRATIDFHSQLHNQHGELVFDVTGDIVVPRRPQ